MEKIGLRVTIEVGINPKCFPLVREEHKQILVKSIKRDILRDFICYRHYCGDIARVIKVAEIKR